MVTRFRRVRTLALLTKSLLTKSLGAKLGANDHRHRVTSSGGRMWRSRADLAEAGPAGLDDGLGPVGDL
jgi:hypothetical protein